MLDEVVVGFAVRLTLTLACSLKHDSEQFMLLNHHTVYLRVLRNILNKQPRSSGRIGHPLPSGKTFPLSVTEGIGHTNQLVDLTGMQSKVVLLLLLLFIVSALIRRLKFKKKNF